MMKAVPVLALAIALGALGTARAADGRSILTYHDTSDRSGNFVVPALTAERARAVNLDSGFQAKLSGHLYAQPLFWREAGTRSGVLFAATESNEVQALDAATGRQLWSRSLGSPVPRAALRCGNISPLGVTGTPVIDPATQTLYVEAAVGGAQGVRHLVFAMALKDGAPLPGWPVDTAEALKQRGQAFNARDQNERGALTILDGRLYVPFGGHFGDCGDYHGWVMGVALRDPREIVAWKTPARGGGIWAPGGITTDGKSLYVATGNTFGASTWMGGEAVIRLSPELKTSADRRDFFTPENWQALDARDLDLGGTTPVLVDLPGSPSHQMFVLALGKDGHAYLLDRDNLGGIGGSLVNKAVSPRPIRTAPAVYSVGGAAFVAFQGTGSRCPAGQPAGDLTVLKITGGDRPALTTVWCAVPHGAGSPIVTTTDGHSEPIVWMVGAEGDNRLHAFKGETGEALFAGGSPNEAMAGLHHFQTLIATDERLYVGADDRIYAFAF
jgi:putative pyrroloquinoline-quinone binding quinoprotein